MKTNVDLNELARSAMRERSLWPDYSVAALKEVSELPEKAILPERNYTDLREKLFFSIDNDDSKDLDQLTYAEAAENGYFKIYIAVADVDSIVKDNSAINEYAQHNTVSVYTPSIIFSMLPKKLSTDLTSLNEDEDRLAIIVEVNIDAEGTIGENYRIYQALVRNHAQLAYNGIGAWLDNKSPSPNPRIDSLSGLADQIKLQDQIASLLRNERFKKGSLTLETIEARPIVKDEQVVEVEVTTINRGRILIEEFMIAANTAVSLFLKAHNKASLRRVVRTPKRWDRIVEIAKEKGVTLPEEPDPISLNQFLKQQQKLDSVRFPDLSLIIIKLLGRGEYIVEYPGQPSVGHFNLAVKDYTHSTAPNRRFPDLITQRLLKSIISKQENPYTVIELERLARHCTLKETDADKVERKLRKCATILLLYSKLNQTFDGIVTGAGPNGTWVRIFNPPAEGKLVQGFQNMDVGDQLQVKLVHLDIEQGFIDFVKI
jgi:exoribonuclease-2